MTSKVTLLSFYLKTVFQHDLCKEMLWAVGNGDSQLKMLYNSHKGMMWANQCFLWYQLTQVVLDKELLNGLCCLTQNLGWCVQFSLCFFLHFFQKWTFGNRWRRCLKAECHLYFSTNSVLLKNIKFIATKQLRAIFTFQCCVEVPFLSVIMHYRYLNLLASCGLFAWN